MCSEPLDFRQGALSVTVAGQPVSAPLHQHGECDSAEATANIYIANAVFALQVFRVSATYMHS